MEKKFRLIKRKGIYRKIGVNILADSLNVFDILRGIIVAAVPPIAILTDRMM